jgi:hypothetical protein
MSFSPDSAVQSPQTLGEALKQGLFDLDVAIKNNHPA